MVGGHVAGSSRRCEECKRRRKKCDLQEPQCLRCRQSGIWCSGPKPKNSTIFVHSQSGSTARDTPRSRLIGAHRSRSINIDRSQRFFRLSVDQLNQVRATLARNQYVSSLSADATILSGRSTLWEPLYLAIINEFTNTSETGIFSGDRNTEPGTKHYSAMAQTIRALLPFAAKYIPALDIAIFSLLAMYYGRLHADAGLVSLARTSYTATLSEVAQYLSRAKAASQGSPQSYYALCCTSIALCCFEHLEQIDTNGSGYTAHLNGALELLKICGPGIAQESPSLKLLVKGFRTIALHNSIQYRRPSFLSDTKWNHGIFGEGDSMVQDRLFSMGLELPCLLQSVDELQSSARDFTINSGESFVLLQQIQSLRYRLQSWLDDFDSTIEGKLFWPMSQPMTGSLRYVDPECKPKCWSSLQQLTFASGTIAGMLCHYWCFKLNLLQAQIIVQKCLKVDDKSCRISDLTLQADKTAQLILEAQPYLTSCLEGTMCIQMVMESIKGNFDQLC